jgi:hypothetical protein
LIDLISIDGGIPFGDWTTSTDPIDVPVILAERYPESIIFLVLLLTIIRFGELE